MAEPTRLNEFNRTCLYRSCCGHWFGICSSPAIMPSVLVKNDHYAKAEGCVQQEFLLKQFRLGFDKPIRCSCLNRESIVWVLVKARQFLVSNQESVSISVCLGLSCEDTKPNSDAVFPLLTPCCLAWHCRPLQHESGLCTILFGFLSSDTSSQDLRHVCGIK